MDMIDKNGLKISSTLFDFVNNEAIPGTKVDPKEFWINFSKFAHELAPINKRLINLRDSIQIKIDEWHQNNKGQQFNKKEYSNFLKSINYLIEEKEDFIIQTSNVDKEISSIAGPQLVVPVDNARYALNAANARWGSLYDAIYGTDVVPGKKSETHDVVRAKKVIDFVRKFLDEVVPLQKESWKNISKVKIENDKLLFLF